MGRITALILLVLVSGSCIEADMPFPPIFEGVSLFDEDLLLKLTEGESMFAPPKVTTEQGEIQGIYSPENTARIFKSIPFAQPPEGDLRWKDPQVITKFAQQPLLAKDDPNVCPQDCKFMKALCDKKYTQSEDCLYLNVYAPALGNPETPYPVMVFIHGGSFIMGYSEQKAYSGEYIAGNTGTILVTINYRLGALGFLNYKDKESEEILHGNYGFKDQQMALTWIKKNIAAFGGDSNKITLFGESAGAASVAMHMTNVDSADLFNQAIIESDPFSIEYLKVEKAQKLGKQLANALDCGSLDELRGKTDSEIVKSQFTFINELLYPGRGVAEKDHPFKTKFQLLMPWAPVVDGTILRGQPVQLLSQKSLKPLIIGTNSHEGRNLILGAVDTQIGNLQKKWRQYGFSFIVYNEFVKTLFNKKIEKSILGLYPSHGLSTKGYSKYNKDLIAELITDYMFKCPTRHVVNGMKSDNGEKTWVYIFEQPYSHNDKKYCNQYACHGYELPYVFHTAKECFNTPSDEEKQLENVMNKYWVNFAHNGDPNIESISDDVDCDGATYTLTGSFAGDGLTKWPDYSDKSSIMVFKTEKKNEKVKTEKVIKGYPSAYQTKCGDLEKLIPLYNQCAETDC